MRGRKEFNVDVLKAIKFLDQACNSVPETSIQNCFMEVRFATSTLKESLETASEFDNNGEEIWARFQIAGFVPKDFNFNKYGDGDTDIITARPLQKVA